MRRVVLPLLLIPFLTASVSARESGVGHEIAVLRGISISIFTYRPAGCAKSRLLFVFHGRKRNAEEYRDAARPLADRLCLIVMAPLFDRDRFPPWRYQRGGIVRKGRPRRPEQWTVNLVGALVEWARAQEGRPHAPYYLFGHSAGGQFLSRVAAFALPPDAARIVIANPSSYVMPLRNEMAPYGIGGVFSGTEAEARLKHYLSLPLTIYLGVRDTGHNNLHNHPAARRQGKNRLERGRSAYRAALALAKANNWACNWRLVEVPRVGHSARRMLAAPQAPLAFGISPTRAMH